MLWPSRGDDRHSRALDIFVNGGRGAPAGAGLAVEEAGEGDVGATVPEDAVGDRVREEGFLVRTAAFSLGGVAAGGDDGVSGVWEFVVKGEADGDLVVEYAVAGSEVGEEEEGKCGYLHGEHFGRRA